MENAKYDLIYTLLQKKLDIINDTYNLLQSKINTLFGFTSAVIAFYLTIILQNHFLNQSNIFLYFFRLSTLFGFIVAFILLLGAIKMRDFDNAPHNDIFLGKEPIKLKSGKLLYNGKRPIDAEYEELISQVIYQLDRAYISNKASLKRPTIIYKASTWLLLIATCFMIASIVF